MLNYIWAGLMLVSIVFGICTGRISQVSDAVFNGAGNAVELFLTLLGVITLWSGLMKIAEKSGLTGYFAKVLSPLLRLLFPGLDPKDPAAHAISMNVSANLLGLGNAATPLGLMAMKELDKMNPQKGVASRHMATFVVLNTASLQLIPTTLAALRMKHGSANPMEIMPAVWMASIVSLIAGMIVCRLLEKRAYRNG